jgi:hypothetical protein
MTRAFVAFCLAATAQLATAQSIIPAAIAKARPAVSPFPVAGCDVNGKCPRRFPLYVETVADFNTGAAGLPNGYASHPIAGAAGYELDLTVTGAQGVTTLTVSAGTVADAQGVWAAVIQHDDGSWDVYSVTTTNRTNTVSIKPPLHKAVTSGTLANLHDAVNGQHFTPNGYRALAAHVWSYPGWKAYRDTYIAQSVETDPGNGKWTEINGIPGPWFVCNQLANAFGSANPLASWWMARNTSFCLGAASANGSQGVEWTQDLGGKTGYVDSYIAADTGTAPAHVTVIIDGTTKLDKDVYGLERIAVQFTKATSGTIRYTFPTGDGGQSTKYRLGTTTWRELPDVVPSSLFSTGAKVVYVGDSWGVFYSGLGPSTLGDYLATIGGSLVNVAVGGMQASWAQANFDTLITANAPDVVVIEFFVNDYNALGDAGVDTWRARIYDLANRCLALGIQPVIIMPTGTASPSQAQGLLKFGAALAEGSPSP